MMFKAWPKIPRLENEVFHITEKIDGTNGCIIIKQLSPENEEHNAIETFGDGLDIPKYGVWAQSRTRIIHPENDNYGFAKWVQDNAEQLIKDLGEGYHFGEWWGQGIQRGYGLNHRRFSLFNPNKHSLICHNVPLLAIDFHIPSKHVVKCLLQEGSKAALGYDRPEGVVVYAEKAKCYWKIILDKY